MQSSPGPTQVSADADPLIGRVLSGRYRIVEAIGQGGMGRVYKALQAPLDRIVAVKILGAGHDSDPSFYKRFFLEASVTARLTHPNTITLYDYGRTDDGVFFIAMEYLAGRTLSQTMQADGPLAQERVIHVAQQICRSLREAHGLGIIHRDLKPANVMLLRQHDDHDFVKVLDFGLVKFFSGENTEEEITNAGTFMGSPHYIAPEQARNSAPDQRCDIYSLGVLLYQMLTGTVPFAGHAPVDIILKHLQEAPVPPRALRPTLMLAPELEGIVLRCMAKRREERFQSMDELLVELKAVRKLLTGGSGPHAVSDPHRAPSGSLATQTPPSGLRTPSQPMNALRATPPGGLRRPARPPAPAAFDEQAESTRRLQLHPTGLRAWVPLVLPPALIVLAGMAAAGIVLRTPPRVLAAPSPAAAASLSTARPVAAATQPAASAVDPPPVTPTTLVTVTSAPFGAEVRDADDRVLGTTPFDLRVPSNRTLQLTLRHEGYKPVAVNRRVEGERETLSITLKSAKPESGEPGPKQRSVGYKDDPY